MDKSTLNKEIGKRIRDMREYNCYTRENLAEYADISVQFLADIEAGRKSMTTHTLYKMSKALNVTTDYLLFGQNTQTDASHILPLLNSLSLEEKKLAEQLLQVYIKGLSLREKTSITDNNLLK